ncbi:hypothetical protein [Marinicrinis sediminis]|uniref:Holin n=1 Tax=Marinicrinis sediminis TaxID=1652465 RepID=A0ABW5RA83_9BACL
MNMEVYDIALIPVIVALVSVCKQLGLPVKWSPVVAIIVGVMFGTLYVSPGNALQGGLTGLTMGLAASGLYSGTKKISRS